MEIGVERVSEFPGQLHQHPISLRGRPNPYVVVPEMLLKLLAMSQSLSPACHTDPLTVSQRGHPFDPPRIRMGPRKQKPQTKVTTHIFGLFVFLSARTHF
jgi:hypothetical protein